MLGFGSLNFNAVGVPKVGVNASDLVDVYDKVMETKDNYIAVNLANDKNSKKRASAAVIGANAGLLQMFALGGIYALVKAFPKLNIPLINKFVVKNFDHWIDIAKKNNPNKSKAHQLLVAFGAKALYAMGTGALLGYGGALYSTERNTIINGKISNTKAGAEGNWISAGLKSLASTEEGQEIIKNSIHKNSDGSITVKFNGINKEYNISKKELKDASKEYISHSNEEGKVTKFEKKFSKGDGDVLAFEVAFEKYCNDLDNGVIKRDKNLPMSIQKITNDGDMLFTDGSVNELYYLLTGKKTSSFDINSDNHDNISEIYAKASLNKFLSDYSQNPEKYSAEIKLKETPNNKLTIRDKYLRVQNIKTDIPYTITKMDAKYVTLADSSKTRQTIEIPVSKLREYIASANYVNFS